MQNAVAVPGTPGWVRDAVFYQVFPDRFASSSRVRKPGPLEAWDAPPTTYGFKGGDLLGIVEHLDHLDDLGVTALYLNPVFASAANHRYHTYDYLAVDPLLGGDAALRELLDAAHSRGMRVVLDGVFNHASRGFWPFHHVLENGAASPYAGWFHLNEEWLAEGRQLVAYPDARLRDTVDSEWGDAHREGIDSLHALGYRAWWDLPALPKLNVANPEARAYLLQVAEHWIRFGADGWRLDVASEIGDAEFWAELRARVRAANQEVYLVAEEWEVDPAWLGPRAFDAYMNYPLAWSLIGFAGAGHLDHDVIASHGVISQRLRQLGAPAFVAQLEASVAAYPAEHVAAQMNLLGSHDTPRVLSLCGGDEASVRLAMLLMLSLPGAPTIYYGDEVGMTGGSDPGCRGAFDWGRESWNPSLFAWLRRAIAVRHARPPLRGDGYRTLAAEGGACAFLRWDGRDGTALVAVNAGAMGVELRVPVARIGQLVLASDDRTATLEAGGDGFQRVTLPPRWGGIWLAG
jgi:cyclomaltodextrinase